MSYTPRLKKDYKERVISELKKQFSYKSVMQVPKILKIVVSKGVGAAVADKKLVEHAIDELTLITGQKAIATLSKKDIASFKLRKGMPIGAKVTLRGSKMYEFLDRLITAALPRVRDFQGLKVSGFDGRGNYTLGVSEQIIFPEIDIDKVNKISGMDITIVTSSQTDQEAKSLLKEIGLPFKNKEMNIKEDEVNSFNKKNMIIDKLESSEEAPSEEVLSEEAPSEEVKSEEVSSEEASSEEVSSEEAPSEEVLSEEAPSEEVKSEEVSSEEASSEEVSSEEVKSEEVSSEEVKSEEVSSEEVKSEEAPSKEKLDISKK